MSGKIGKSNMAGKCTAGTHDIAVGQDNYYEKVNEKWIRCTDLECFKKQGGTYDPNAKPQFKSRSKETRFSDAIGMLDLLWPVAKAKALAELPFLPNAANPALDDNMRDRRILQATFLHNLVQEYTR